MLPASTRIPTCTMAPAAERGPTLRNAVIVLRRVYRACHCASVAGVTSMNLSIRFLLQMLFRSLTPVGGVKLLG